MGITELAVLRWLHIIAMVYWLGGEWGVFNTSTHVINRDLSMEERRRHDQMRELVQTLRAEHAVEIALRVRQNSVLVQRQTKTVPVLRGGVYRTL